MNKDKAMVVLMDAIVSMSTDNAYKLLLKECLEAVSGEPAPSIH